MTIQQDLQKDVVDAVVELYQVDLTALGGSILYLTPNTVGGSAMVSFGGTVYIPMPISGEGWAKSTDGQPPRPTLKISNATRFIQPYLTAYDDCVGARVTRVETLSKYLDSGATPDSSQVFSENVFLIEQARLNKREVEFTLTSILDAPQFMLPRGQVLRSIFPGAGLFRKNQ